MPKAPDRHTNGLHAVNNLLPYPLSPHQTTTKRAAAAKKMASAAQTALADTALLSKIDKLFACGVGEQVNLPQIVVVGDQSSGKSSVLESLVSKAFPRDSGLCTRFATQLIFKRAAEETISVSIIPDSSADADLRARLEAWQPTEVASLDGDEFVRVMQEVHEVLGLSSTNGDSAGKPTFSDSVLRLEITGPQQEHLSVIDVPGIFKSTTAGLTTKADIALVRKMVSEYMENPRSVMLVVIPANVDVATQEIIEMAHDVDPEGNRTLGVLTKPDLVDKGAEARVLDMVNERTWKMKLGWHILRNPGQQELNDANFNRNRLEADFFRSTAPWSEVEKSKVGVETLRVKLTDVLSLLVKREFPKVKNDILKKLGTKQKQLKDLGPERSSVSSQLAHLTDVSVKFQQLMTHAIDGKFGERDMVGMSDVKLASLASTRMAAFSDDVAKHGHSYAFGKVATTNSLGLDDDALHELPENGIQTRMEVLNGDDLSEILVASAFVGGGKKGNITGWLEKTYKQSRGFELGTFEPSILAEIMKQQSKNWSDLSLGFISDVIILVHKCIIGALVHLTTDAELRQALLDALMDGLIQRYRKAVEQTNFLNIVENGTIPFTVNHYFNDNLQKLRQDRVTKHMKALAKTRDNYSGPTITLDDAIQSHPMSNAEHTAQDIHDILLAYYKVARKRFVDNVVQQAAFHHLLCGEDNPLQLFSPSWVSRLSPEELSDIAGEAPRVTKSRSQLEKEIASLVEAKTILAKG